MASSGDPLCYLRYLVMGLRVDGSFPFWLGRSSQLHPTDLPRFSATLFLWSIFTKLLIISRCLDYHTTILSMYNKYTTGEILNVLLVFILTYLYHAGSIVILCVSPYLARVFLSLEDLHSDQLLKMATSVPHMKILRLMDHQTLLHICINLSTYVGALYSTFENIFWSIPAKVASSLTATFVVFDSFLFLLTYKEILNLLGKYIKNSASWAVDGMPGGSNKLPQDHTPTGMQRLFHLERQFLKASTHQNIL